MCNNPRFYSNIKNPMTGELYPVPCHRCAGCRIDRRVMWEARISAEEIKGRNAFLTLTYDDYHVPYNAGCVRPTLRQADVSNFIDCLRHKTNKIKEFPYLSRRDWKFVSVGEYGDNNTRRPHYHLLLLGLDFHDFSKLIEKTWKKGLVDIGPIRRGGIRYVLKYMDKQQYGEYAHRLFTDNGIEIPKMSFSPGIGKDFFISQIENINKYGSAKIGQRLVPVPSYWKNKLFNFCDKNIYERMEHSNEYVRQMDSQCRSMGYDSYSDFLRANRRNLELSYEKKSLKQHILTDNLSDHLPTSRLPPEADLILNYKSESDIDVLSKRIYL